ncbi:hypothetical protein DNTS_005393 [Danionella cerebrum]|uniref:Uncharacterized protein n=1 Tax=Danionella cerebrum TaxID=2873325 RepID=A0A553QTS4_9TELE|nr:hypothetical protein DNTS_005393 [Danionella translucida]
MTGPGTNDPTLEDTREGTPGTQTGAQERNKTLNPVLETGDETPTVTRQRQPEAKQCTIKHLLPK